MNNKTGNLNIRPMDIDEIHRISEIDVSETGTVVYKWVNGEVQAVDENWERPSSYGEGWKPRADLVTAGLAKGGIALGAFDGGQLIGFVALQHRLEDEIAEIMALWISAAYRRGGLASRLVQEVINAARDTGATSIYVSVCPSESAMGFFRSLGFTPWAFVHRELYELEPEDIHMILKL